MTKEGELAGISASKARQIPWTRTVLPAPNWPYRAMTEPGPNCLARVAPIFSVSAGEEDLILKVRDKLAGPHDGKRKEHLFQRDPPVLKAIAVFSFVLMVVGRINEIVVFLGKNVGCGQGVLL